MRTCFSVIWIFIYKKIVILFECFSTKINNNILITNVRTFTILRDKILDILLFNQELKS